MQFELKALQRDVGITFIYVTHDQEEAITMADRIAVMNDGKMLQVGTPKAIYEHPKTHFVADFIGETNFISGTLVEKGDDGYGRVRLADGIVIRAQLSQALGTADGAVSVAIRPERIGIAAEGDSADPAGPGMTVLNALLADSQYIGTDTRFTLQIGDGIELVARLQNVNNLDYAAYQTGQTVKVFWQDASTTVLDR